MLGSAEGRLVELVFAERVGRSVEQDCEGFFHGQAAEPADMTLESITPVSHNLTVKQSAAIARKSRPYPPDTIKDARLLHHGQSDNHNDH